MGSRKARPLVFYRGERPRDTAERCLTGEPDWDRCLFVSSRLEAALSYGPEIDVWSPLPETRILYEGSREWRSVARGLFRPGTRVLPDLAEVVRRAEREGYAAVWFIRQEDFGTAIMDPAQFSHCPHGAEPFMRDAATFRP